MSHIHIYTPLQADQLAAANDTLLKEMRRVLGETTPEMVGMTGAWQLAFF